MVEVIAMDPVEEADLGEVEVVVEDLRPAEAVEVVGMDSGEAIEVEGIVEETSPEIEEVDRKLVMVCDGFVGMTLI